MNADRARGAQEEALREAAKRKREKDAADLRKKRSCLREGGEAAVTRAATGEGRILPVSFPENASRNERVIQRKLKKLRRQIKCGAVRLETGKESVTRLQEAARWRQGRDIPGGGYEIEFNRGWGSEEKWVTWLRVRPSGLLRQANAPEDSATKWGLYAARKFRAGDSIGTVTGPALRDLGTLGSVEARAALRVLRTGRDGHHAIQLNGRLIDGADAVSGVQYANSAAGVSGRANNAAFKRTGTLAADTQIEEGEEILVPWGEYWPPPQKAGARADEDAGASSGAVDAVVDDGASDAEPEERRAAAAVKRAYTAAEDEAAGESERKEQIDRARKAQRRSEEQQREAQQRKQEEQRKEQAWQTAKVGALDQRRRDKRQREDGTPKEADKRKRKDSSAGAAATAGAAAAGGGGAAATAGAAVTAAGAARAGPNPMHTHTAQTAQSQQHGQQPDGGASSAHRHSGTKRRAPGWSERARRTFYSRTSLADGRNLAKVARCEGPIAIFATDAPT